jgi:hypothetical protein
VYVYLHSTLKAKSLEELISRALSGAQVTVFSRVKDLEDAMQAKPSGALLTYPPVHAKFQLTPVLRGQAKQKDWEPYVSMSVGKALPKAELAGKTIGVLDTLGRKETTDHVTAILGGMADFKLKRVIKLEDMLPLLQFGAAEALILPASAATEIRSRSQQELAVSEIEGARAELPAVAALGGNIASALKDRFVGMDSKVKAALGVESWR